MRAFETKTGAPRPISPMMHLNTTARFEKEKVEKEEKAVEKEKNGLSNEVQSSNVWGNITL